MLMRPVSCLCIEGCQSFVKNNLVLCSLPVNFPFELFFISDNLGFIGQWCQ